MDKIYKPGIYENISIEEYKSIHALNKSSMVAVAQSPNAYHRYKLKERKLSKSLALGIAIDMLLFTPAQFYLNFKKHPLKTPREYKVDETRTIYYIHPDDWQKIENMHIALKEHKICSSILSSGRSQLTLIWNDQEHGFLCKARPDWTCDDIHIMADLKTTKNADKKYFSYDADRYKYMWQAAWYVEGMAALTGETYQFVFICIENTDQYVTKEQIAVYRAPEIEIQAALSEMEQAKRNYVRYLSGDRSGFAQNIEDLYLKTRTIV